MPRPIRGTIDVHTHKDGLRTYYVRMTVDGRRERERLGTDREGWTPGRALVALEERLEAVRAGTWKRPQEPRVGDDDPTFRLFASSWLEDNMLEWRPSTIADIKWRLESHLLPHVGEERLSTFDIPRVTAVKTTLLKESRRISERLEAGVVERDPHNMPLPHSGVVACPPSRNKLLECATPARTRPIQPRTYPRVPRRGSILRDHRRCQQPSSP